MRTRRVAAQVLVAGLLAAGLVPAAATSVSAKDVDAHYVQTYRGQYLRFGKGGRAFVWIQQIWDMDQLHSTTLQPAPSWRACVSLLYPNGTSEGDCGGTRVESASTDPFLRRFDVSFSMASLDTRFPRWRVVLRTHQRSQMRVHPSTPRSYSLTTTPDPAVRYRAEAGASGYQFRRQTAQGRITTPMGRKVHLRSPHGDGGYLSRRIGASASADGGVVGRPHIEVPPQAPPLPRPWPLCWSTCR